MQLNQTLTKNKLVREALAVARERLKNMFPSSLTKQEMASGVRKLDVALAMTGVNTSQVSTIWVLFPPLGSEISKMRRFARRKGFGTISEIVDRSIEEIRSEMSRFGLVMPITLQTFYEAYQELAAEKINV